MRFFSSTSTHKIDAKGRVSIPAAFRKVLEADGASEGEGQCEVVLIPNLSGEPAIEGLTRAHFNELLAAINRMPPFAKATRSLKHKVAGKARSIQLEDTGRFVLAADLRAAAGLGDQALFVGLGPTFQIWNPDTYATVEEDYDETAMENFHLLPWGDSGGGAA